MSRFLCAAVTGLALTAASGTAHAAVGFTAHQTWDYGTHGFYGSPFSLPTLDYMSDGLLVHADGIVQEIVRARGVGPRDLRAPADVLEEILLELDPAGEPLGREGAVAAIRALPALSGTAFPALRLAAAPSRTVAAPASRTR